jgi:hypothetical protein
MSTLCSCGAKFDDDPIVRIEFQTAHGDCIVMDVMSKKLKRCPHCVPSEASIIKTFLRVFEETLQDFPWHMATITWLSGQHRVVLKEELNVARN